MVAGRSSKPRSRVLTLHVFEKVRALDITLAEFEQLLDGGEVIEERQLRVMELKQVVLVSTGYARCTSSLSLTTYDRRRESSPCTNPTGTDGSISARGGGNDAL